MAAVNFFDSGIARWQDVATVGGTNIPLASLAPRFTFGSEIWIVQTFHILRSLGYPCRLSAVLDPSAINVMHYDDTRTPDLWRAFVVSARCDRDPSFLAQAEIVQNLSSVWADNNIYVPSWPQPGLIPRDPARGSLIERLAFFGHEENLVPAAKSDAFRTELARLGMSLVIKEKPADWGNYSDVDVVLALRGGDSFFRALKPAAKVTNSWLAGCPVIAGREHAYREIRQSPLDYFEVETADGVLASLRQLKSTPGLYEQMIANGRERAQPFTERAVAGRWIEALDGPISRLFECWGATTPAARRLKYVAGRARNIVWGPHAVLNPSGGWKRLIRPLRRTISHPGHLRMWRVPWV